MNNVEFDGDNDFSSSRNPAGNKFMYAKIQASSKTPQMISFIMKSKIVKTEKNAEYLLIAIILLCIILSVVAYHYAASTPTFTQEQIINYLNQHYQ